MQVHTDGIPVPVQDPAAVIPAQRGCGRTYGMNATPGRNRPSGLVRIFAGMQGHTSAAALSGCKSILRAGAFGGYNALNEDGLINEASCMVHARQKIHDVHDRKLTDITIEALKSISELCAVEAEFRGSPVDERLSVRKASTVPVPLMQAL